MTDSTARAVAGETADPAVVHVIQSRYHYRDLDNRDAVEDTILEDEGWFADRAAAQARTTQLNARNRVLYDTEMARAERERATAITRAEHANREAAILRANGIAKTDVVIPAPFRPVPFDDYVPSGGHTTYEVLEIRRSDYDGITKA